MSVTTMLAEARESLGLREPNHIQSWYRGRNGAAYGGNFPWCDAAVSFWAAQSGNHPAVCPKGDRAYTVYHATDFQKLGRWHYGISGIRAGDIVFFDWGNKDSIAAIDHVGVVEKVLSDGRVQTIEGNTADMCARRIRSGGPIAGYGRPAYTAVSAPSSKVTAPSGTPYLRRGSTGSRVKQLQQALNKALKSGLAVDGDFGPKTEAAVKALQRKARITVDGIYGPQSARALARLLA